MKRNYISEVIDMFLRNNYPRETENKIQQWMIQENDVSEKKYALHEYWDSLHIAADKKTYQSLYKVKEKLGIHEVNHSSFLHARYLRIVAIFIPLFLIAGTYFYLSNIYNNDRFAKVEVPYGEQKQICLPDGSTVKINAGSSIQYPKQFDANSRTVTLIGEAFFSVIKDPSKPFVVRTKKISVSVLGTTFNVSAYPDEEKTITTLSSGKVEVKTASKKTFTLEPAQQLTYNNRTAGTDIHRIPEENIQGWTTGHLIFEYRPIGEIFRVLERKYNVTCKIDKSLFSKNDHFSVKFVNNESLDQILDILKDICGFSYTISGKNIQIKDTDLSAAAHS